MLFALMLEAGGKRVHLQACQSFNGNFDELAVIGDAVSEEDRVVDLLAGLPNSNNLLAMSLEARQNVSEWNVMTEGLLHEVTKKKEK